MEEIIEKLLQRITASMPEISYVGEDLGQLETSGEAGSTPLTLPAVLVGCTATEWTSLQGLSQKGNATFKISLLTDCSTGSSLSQRGAMRTELHKLIQGYKATDTATGLIRSASKSFRSIQGAKVYETTYTCTVDEQASEQKITNVEILKIHTPQIF